MQFALLPSLTKLMTAVVVRENLNMDAYITVGVRATLVEGKKAKLKVGDTIRVEDALYGLLMESGNDVAVALEEYYNSVIPREYGSSLVYDMNVKAESLGLERTRFVDPVGLSNFNVSTAYEVTKLLKHASGDELLQKIMGTQEYEYDGKIWKNTNTLIGNKYGILGGKTGYTDEAGQSISLRGMIRGEEVLMVMLNISTHRIIESASFFDWLKGAFRW